MKWNVTLVCWFIFYPVRSQRMFMSMDFLLIKHKLYSCRHPFAHNSYPTSDYTRIFMKWNVTASCNLYDRMNCALLICIMRLHFRCAIFFSHASHNGLALSVFGFCIHMNFRFWPQLSHSGYWQARQILYLARCAFLSKLSSVAGGDLSELGDHIS